MGKLQDKVAIITGGALGIGYAVAERFREEGARVVILDWKQEELEAACAALRIDGERCDVSDHAMVDAVIDSVRTRHGAIDILVNNAGIAHIGNALTTTAEDFERVQRVNVFGPANVTRAVLRHMVADARGGSIVNLASCLSVMAIADRFAYGASKGAVLAMTYSVAKDFLEHKIRCNAILPGRVHTPFVDGFIAQNYPGREAEMFDKLSKAQPIGRMASPREIAYAALFLASDEAAFITGIGLPVDGGTLSIR